MLGQEVDRPYESETLRPEVDLGREVMTEVNEEEMLSKQEESEEDRGGEKEGQTKGGGGGHFPRVH